MWVSSRRDLRVSCPQRSDSVLQKSLFHINVSVFASALYPSVFITSRLIVTRSLRKSVNVMLRLVAGNAFTLY